MKSNYLNYKILSLLFFITSILPGQYIFSQQKVTATEQKMKGKEKVVDTAVIERVTGLKGKSNKGEYKITIPQNDLNVEVDGFKIIPPMGLGTWVAFTPLPNGVMLMGDLVLTETDLKPVQSEVIRQ